jgi:hypothetical protein
MMNTITGTLTCHRYAQGHHRRSLLASLLADLTNPLPPREIWTIDVDDPTQPARPPDGKRTIMYRTKSGRLPAALSRDMDGTTVTIKATVTPRSNGLGGYISRIALIPADVREVLR